MDALFDKVTKGLERHNSGDCDPDCPYWNIDDACSDLYVDAIALIGQQQERIVELEAAQQWISAKDRLPENEQDVLAYLDDGEETRIAPCNYANGGWFDCMMNCVVVLRHVTHWMPLPEPPKEADQCML
jgi:hypothetical protein